MGAPVAVEIPASVRAGAAAGQFSVATEGAATLTTTTGHDPSAEMGPARSDDRAVVMLPLDQIRPSRFQPRRNFDEAHLAELAASIRSAGVVQPIVVRSLGESGASAGEKYELIAGERRWRACRLAGLARVPAVVTAASDEQAAEWALIENLQREDLRPMERADAVRALIERFGLSHAQAAERLGIDRSSVANLVRMTDLEMPLRELLDLGTLAAGHGKALLGVGAGEKRVQLGRRAAAQGWSVRRLEQAITGAVAGTIAIETTREVRAKVETASARAAAVQDLERQLGEHLGTSVKIRTSPGGKRGTLAVRFFDLDHFDGLMQKFGFALK